MPDDQLPPLSPSSGTAGFWSGRLLAGWVRAWRAVGQWLYADGQVLNRERVLVALLPLMLLVGHVTAANVGVVNDAYSYEDNFDDNNGVDANASQSYQNIGGILQATGNTMVVVSPCFSLPQPAGGTFNKWLFLDVAVAQLTNTDANTLAVQTCAGGNLLTRTLAAGTTSVDLSGIDPANSQIRLSWSVNHVNAVAAGGLPARLDFWKVYGDATGASTVAVTALSTSTGAGGQLAVRINITSTGASTRNAVLRIPMSEINGLSATGTAVAPFVGLMTDAEKDYGNGAGMQVYRPVQLFGYTAASDGTGATNALVNQVAGELRYNLGTLPSGYSGSVNLNFLVQQGTVNGSTFKIKAYLDHGATPTNALHGAQTLLTLR